MNDTIDSDNRFGNEHSASNNPFSIAINEEESGGRNSLVT